MTGSDLVAAGYPLTYWLRKLRGGGQSGQSNISQRSNIELIAGLNGLADTAAALTSGEVTVVAVPVETGDTIKNITARVGATAAVTPTHQWAAVYSSGGLLLGQTADKEATAIAASKEVTYTFANPVNIIVGPGGNTENGFVFVALSITAGTVPSLATVSIAAAVGYAWPNGPAQLCGLGGAALAGKAPAELPALAAQAACPLVFVS